MKARVEFASPAEVINAGAVVDKSLTDLNITDVLITADVGELELESRVSDFHVQIAFEIASAYYAGLHGDV